MQSRDVGGDDTNMTGLLWMGFALLSTILSPLLKLGQTLTPHQTDVAKTYKQSLELVQ